MTDDRDVILARIRASLDNLDLRAARTEFPSSLPTAATRIPHGGTLEDFQASFEAAAGRLLADIGELVALLRAEGIHCAYCDPRLPATVGDAIAAAGIETVKDYDRQRMDDIGAGITPASAAIAETGTLVLTDADTTDRLSAVAPWVHVAVLDPDTVVPRLVDALASLPEDPNVVFVTGPSQTADVEGILIRGVHGPGVQACLTLKWRSPGESR